MARRLPAVFMRGGTSKAIMLRREDLPDDPANWDPIFLAIMGSPDPNGRQLDGMGGGISSLSKICVISPSDRPDADVDYTFAQVAVDRARVDHGANCGNMSSAVGPFAVAENLVAVAENLVAAPGDSEPDNLAEVRIYNTNTDKIIISRFPVRDGLPLEQGTARIPGVSGTGAPIRLAFVEPGGAATGRLLPSGAAAETLDVPGYAPIEASIVDSASLAVFVRATDVGLTGTESPTAIDANRSVMAHLEAIRQAASVRAGIAADMAEAADKLTVPRVAVVAPPTAAETLSGETLAVDDCDVTARMISVGNCHRALPLTGALCTATAARLPGTLVHAATRPTNQAGAEVRVAQPSGLLVVDARLEEGGDGWVVREARVLRTARRLMEGNVLVPDRAYEPRAVAVV